MAPTKPKSAAKRHFRLHLSPSHKRWLLYLGCGLLAAYVLLTIFTWVAYRHKFFPRTTYSSSLVGNSGFSQASLTKALPAQVELTVDQDTLKQSPEEIGITAAPDQTLKQLQAERRLSPLLAFRLFTKHTYPLGITTNDNTLNTFIATKLAKYEKAPQDAHLAVEAETVKVVAAASGKKVDSNQLKKLFTQKLASNYTKFGIPFTAPAANTDSNLESRAKELNDALSKTVTINYTGGNYRPTKGEKAGWLSASGNELSFDSGKISGFLVSLQAKLGQSWDNQTAAAGQIAAKLNARSDATVTMHDKPKAVITYSYCVALKNVPDSYRGAFASKVRATFVDARGWGLNGRINFVEASSGCNFTMWLAAANDLPGFGPGVCDNYYSCTVSPNVIINFDRWQGATDPWNAAGGSMDDYRSMVINHETGHWLGFGHRMCPGAGQAAPVMQQQSISLQGCKFNPWPTSYELSALAQIKGI